LRIARAGMRRSLFVLVPSVGLSLGLTATAQVPDQLSAYCNDPHPEIRLLACSVIIERATAKAEALADAFTSRGTAFAITGDQNRAIQDFDRALMLDPNRSLTFGFRGSAYFSKGDYDRAIADYDRAVRLDPDYADAFYGRASAWHAKGEEDRAIADYSGAIALDPKYLEAYADRGLAHLAKDELGSAIDDFNLALQLDPNDAEAFDLRGGAYLQMGDNDRAIVDYDQAIFLDPNYAPAYFDRGVARFMKARFAEAAVDFAVKPQAEPANAYAALWLHMARRKAGEDDTAEVSRTMANLNLDRWPGPIIRLYRGQTAPEDVRAAAMAGTDEKRKKRRSCQAAFYIGEYQSLRGNTNAAVPIFEDAAIHCPHDLPEYDGATAELGWLP
jgi:lipoprotein NlpI